MAITPYATVSDLADYLGTEAPADGDRLLSQAQDLIDDLLMVFATDSSGNPTDAGVIAAFKKAVCAQAEYWLANGDELDQLQEFSSYSIEGISVTRANDARPQADVCPRARAALRTAGLLPATIKI